MESRQCGTLGEPGWPGSRGRFLCRKSYALAFDTESKVALWTAERLTREHMLVFEKGNSAGDFREDPDLGILGPKLADYRGSDYDRGHLAADHNSDWDPVANRQTYLLSNVAPMVGNGMNRHLWKKLEGMHRDWATCADVLWVYTGPVLAKPLQAGKFIGRSRIAVPTHFFKVVYHPTLQQAIAFLVENRNHKGRKPAEFVVAVDQVEALTGLDFLPALPDKLESRLEAKTPTLWRSQPIGEGTGRCLIEFGNDSGR